MSVGVRWAFDLMSWKPCLNDILLGSAGIQVEEKKRIDQFVFQKDARSSLIGRLLMRKYACRTTNEKWESIDIGRDNNNKPFLKNCNDVKFNVSHQGGYAVLAGEMGNVKLGVDVMKQEYTGGKPLSEFFRLMTRNFSPSEWTTILSSEDERKQMEMFFRFWTLKESYVKATGTGITVPLDEISFKISSELSTSHFTTDTRLYLDSVEQDGWTFQEMALDSNHCVSVALFGAETLPSLSNKFTLVPFSDIISYCKPLTPLDTAYAQKFLNKPISPQVL